MSDEGASEGRAGEEQLGESAMERLRRIRGVSWEWAEPDHPSYRPGRQMGVIAQEVEAVFPRPDQRR
jgi:endosialidase-like protein